MERCIVIGASAGGVETLKEVVSCLPSDLPSPVFIVLHIPRTARARCRRYSARLGLCRHCTPRMGAKIEAGRIYVAPPDHHLLIDQDRVAVKKGPKENRFRPSIDALFRSAAYVCGPRAIGVVLSGALDDGTSGLWSIKRLGGLTIVQEPKQSRFESMPRSALDYVDADYSLASTEIGALLGRLVKEHPVSEEAAEAEIKARMGTEVGIAIDNSAFQKGVMELGDLTPFTCPACHGALVRIAEGKTLRFRCHTGHAFTDNALLEGVMESTGEMLWQVIRSLEESAMLLSHMGERLKDAGDDTRAEIFFSKARELEKRSGTFHEDVLRHESLSGDNVGQRREE